jgi:hypothetical protein
MHCKPEFKSFINQELSADEIEEFKERIKETCPLLEDYKKGLSK